MSKREKKKKRGCSTFMIGFLIVLVVAGGLFGGGLVLRDITGANGTDKSFVVEIPEGAGTSTVASLLRNRNIIKYPGVFKLYAKLMGDHVYQKGRHTLSPGMSYHELFSSLESLPDQEDPSVRKITIPEGYELRQIADLLEQKGLINREIFMQEIETGEFDYPFVNKISRKENRLEGYLFPDTYQFGVDETEHQIIDKMLANFNNVAVPAYEAVHTPFSLDEIVTLASVVEREAANDQERGLVAGVFMNRINAGMKLESCATVQYILKERKTILSNQDIAIDSKYNTYKYKGLPVGPIAAPGLASIQAALSPEKTDYMYFVATADGSQNLFSETFEEHSEKIREVQGGGQ